MTNVVDVRDDTRTRIGTITFDPSPAHLPARRTASGFELTLPITVSRVRGSLETGPCHLSRMGRMAWWGVTESVQQHE